MSTEKDIKKPQGNAVLHGVMPRFCFVCGSKLEEQTLGWLQCEKEDCAEMFLPYLDEEGNQCLMLQNTPFTPK